jgi:hypothetical protein
MNVSKSVLMRRLYSGFPSADESRGESDENNQKPTKSFPIDDRLSQAAEHQHVSAKIIATSTRGIQKKGNERITLGKEKDGGYNVAME